MEGANAGNGRNGSCGPHIGVFLVWPSCVHTPVLGPLTKQEGHFQAEEHGMGPHLVTYDLLLVRSEDGLFCRP